VQLSKLSKAVCVESQQAGNGLERSTSVRQSCESITCNFRLRSSIDQSEGIPDIRKHVACLRDSTTHEGAQDANEPRAISSVNLCGSSFAGVKSRNVATAMRREEVDNSLVDVKSAASESNF
jgi:hypothetical protein